MHEQLARRETRARSPEFQRAMSKENAEFVSALNEFGHNALDAGYTAILKTPTALFVNTLKAIYSRKYNAGHWQRDAFSLFLGKNGVAHNTLKVATNAVYLAGKGAKIGIRQLFKV